MIVRPSTLNHIPLQFLKFQKDMINNENEKRVLSLLREKGACSRPEIAKHLGISAQAVLKIVEKLIDRRLLTTGEKIIQGPGQPSLMIDIAEDAAYSFGISIRQDGFQIVLMDLRGHIHFAEDISMSCKDRIETLQKIYNLIERTLQQTAIDRSRLFGIGFALSGFFIQKKTKINTPYAMEDWARENLTEEISDQLHLPVWIENDASAAAVGESLYGWGKVCKNFALIYMDYGLGGGVIVNGRLLEGENGNAGEFTGLLPVEMRPQRPTLNLLLEMVQQQYPHIQNITQLFEGLENHNIDLDQTDFIDITAKPFTHIISAISAILDPELIILGGRLPETVLDQMIHKSSYFTLLIRNADRTFPRIEKTKINYQNIALGAATLPFMQYFF